MAARVDGDDRGMRGHAARRRPRIELLPYLLILPIALLLLTRVPALVTFLPDLMMGPGR